MHFFPFFFFDEIFIQAPGKHFRLNQNCLRRNGLATNPGDKTESDYHFPTFGRFHMTSSQITRPCWYAKIFVLFHNSDFFYYYLPCEWKMYRRYYTVERRYELCIRGAINSISQAHAEKEWKIFNCSYHENINFISSAG